MKKTSKFFALALAGLMALAVPCAWAQTGNGQNGRPEWRDGGHKRGHRGGFGMGRGFANLNLTDAQKAQMKQISESYRERTKALHQELRTKEQELRQASEGNTFNEAFATQKLTEAAALRAKLMGEQFKLRQEMQAVLTPEQKQQIEQQREQFKQKREQFRTKRAERSATQVQ
jgi:periplasmic protein CpxP/Spy